MKRAPSPRSQHTPITPIVCAGSPREIGEAQGAAAADLVRGARASLRELEAFRLLEPWWLPHAPFVRLAEHRAARVWRRSVRGTVPGIADRAAGIAVGAGVRQRSVQLLNVLEPMVSDLSGVTVAPPLGGCSAVAVSGAAAADGEPFIARNFDYLPLIQPFYMMRETRPAGGLGSLDFTCAPLAGAVDGVNEAGLSIACNYGYVRDRSAYGGTITMLVADALARCATVEQAAEHIAGRRRWGGGLLMLADASGAVASLELSNRNVALRRPEPHDRGVLFHTNRFQTARMRGVEVPERARFTHRAPAPLRGRFVHDSSTERDIRFARLLADRDTFAPRDILAVMSDHGAVGEPTSNSICMHSDYWSTTATLLLFPRSRRIRVAFEPTCRARHTELELFRGVVGPRRLVGCAS